MSRLRLYIDEDAMDEDLVRGLRSGGIDVVTAEATGRTEQRAEQFWKGLSRRAAESQPNAGLENASRLVRIPGRPIDNRPQVANLPHIPRCTQADTCATLTR